jgi:hypothetical protein
MEWSQRKHDAGLRVGDWCGRCARPRVERHRPRPTSSGGPSHRPDPPSMARQPASRTSERGRGECCSLQSSCSEAGLPECARHCCRLCRVVPDVQTSTKGSPPAPDSNGSSSPLPPVLPRVCFPRPETWRPARPRPPSRSPPARG